MSITRTRVAKMLRTATLLFIVILIAGYAAWRSTPYFRGPSLEIFQPADGSTISSTTVTLAGRATRANLIEMNGAPIEIDEEGNFRETLIVFPGVNIVSLDVTDQFKRKIHAELRLMGTQSF